MLRKIVCIVLAILYGVGSGMFLPNILAEIDVAEPNNIEGHPPVADASAAEHVWKQVLIDDSISIKGQGIQSPYQLSNGNLIFIEPMKSEIYLFDSTTYQWTRLPNTNQGGYIHTPVELLDGRLMVFTGSEMEYTSFGGVTGEPTRRAEIYNFLTGEWVVTGDMVKVRDYSMAHPNFSTTVLRDGRILIAGGNGERSTEYYDPATNQWALGVDLGTKPEYGNETVLLKDGRVLFIIKNHTGVYYQVYNPEQDTWSPVKKIPYNSYIDRTIKSPANPIMYFFLPKFEQPIMLDSGKVFITSDSGIYLYNPDVDEWIDTGYVPNVQDVTQENEYYSVAKIGPSQVLLNITRISNVHYSQRDNTIDDNQWLIYNEGDHSFHPAPSHPEQIQPMLYKAPNHELFAIGEITIQNTPHTQLTRITVTDISDWIETAEEQNSQSPLTELPGQKADGKDTSDKQTKLATVFDALTKQAENYDEHYVVEAGQSVVNIKLDDELVVQYAYSPESESIELYDASTDLNLLWAVDTMNAAGVQADLQFAAHLKRLAESEHPTTVFITDPNYSILVQHNRHDMKHITILFRKKDS